MRDDNFTTDSDPRPTPRSRAAKHRTPPKYPSGPGTYISDFGRMDVLVHTSGGVVRPQVAVLVNSASQGVAACRVGSDADCKDLLARCIEDVTSANPKPGGRVGCAPSSPVEVIIVDRMEFFGPGAAREAARAAGVRLAALPVRSLRVESAAERFLWQLRNRCEAEAHAEDSTSSVPEERFLSWVDATIHRWNGDRQLAVLS